MRRLWVGTAVLGLTLVGFGTSTALAQSSTMTMSIYGGEESFKPDLSQRDLKAIVRVLGLAHDEEQALQDLYTGYASTLQTEGAAVRQFVDSEMERSEIMQNTALLSKAQKRIADWEKRSEQIKKVFLDDLKSLLSREQEARWPIVERELRRLRTIGEGRLSGESIDLVRLTEDVLGEPPGKELGDLLNRYSDELDKALVARGAFLEENRKAFTDSVTSDPQKAKGIWDGAQRVRMAVRDINDRYERLIADQLSPDKKAELDRRYFDQSYRAVAGPTHAEEFLKDALELPTLCSEQRDSLKQAKAKYDAERRVLVVAGARAWRQFEGEARPRELAEALGERPKDENHQAYTGAWLPDSHPLIQYRKERLTLDQGLRKSLDSILTSEQRATVPTRTWAKYESWDPWGL